MILYSSCPIVFSNNCYVQKSNLFFAPAAAILRAAAAGTSYGIFAQVFNYRGPDRLMVGRALLQVHFSHPESAQGNRKGHNPMYSYWDTQANML